MWNSCSDHIFSKHSRNANMCMNKFYCTLENKNKMQTNTSNIHSSNHCFYTALGIQLWQQNAKYSQPRRTQGTIITVCCLTHTMLNVSLCMKHCVMVSFSQQRDNVILADDLDLTQTAHCCSGTFLPAPSPPPYCPMHFTHRQRDTNLFLTGHYLWSGMFMATLLWHLIRCHIGPYIPGKKTLGTVNQASEY
jgi:hypothetical protein